MLEKYTKFLLLFIDSLNQYSDLIIVGLTLAVIYLTAHSARSSRNAIRLNALPILFSKFTLIKGKSFLILENHSNHPAYDVEIWIMGEYQNEETPYYEMLDLKYSKDIILDFSKSLYQYPAEHYAVIDKMIHYAFPPRASNLAELNFIKVPRTLQIVLQFRDSMNYNYLYQGWLFADTFKDGEYKLGALSSSFRTTKRINYPSFSIEEIIDLPRFTNHIPFLLRYSRLVPRLVKMVVNKIRGRIFLKRDIRDSLLRSFHAGYQRQNKEFGVEGRGIFNNLM